VQSTAPVELGDPEPALWDSHDLSHDLQSLHGAAIREWRRSRRPNHGCPGLCVYTHNGDFAAARPLARETLQQPGLIATAEKTAALTQHAERP
jgi:hypothetical protein